MAYKVETQENQGLQSHAGAHSRYALFLIEQLIVILIFALCAAICVKIFTDSYLMAQASNNVNNALIVAESGAEVFKAAKGDAGKIAGILDGVNKSGTVNVFYGEDWNPINENDAAYVLALKILPADGVLINCDVSVNKADGENIVEFKAAVRK